MAAQDTYFDELETRNPAERKARLLEALALQVAHAADKAPHYAGLLADVDPRAIEGYAAFSALPVTRKSDLKELQSVASPFGGLRPTKVMTQIPRSGADLSLARSDSRVRRQSLLQPHHWSH